MQTGVVLLCQLHGQAGTLIAGFLATYLGVMPDVGIVAKALLGRGHIAVDDGRVLTMGHNRQTGSSKDAVKGFAAVDEHIAR